jgi:predicted GNAT family acetyltransferase
MSRVVSATGGGPHRFVRLSPRWAPQAVQCITDVFSAPGEDPFTVALGLTPRHWTELCAPFVLRAASARHPLSVVAVSADGTVDGVMISGDYAEPTPAAYRNSLSKEWEPVRAIFRELHAGAGDGAAASAAPSASYPTPGEVMQVMYFTGVRQGARGKGLAKGLWHASIEAAREANYRSVVVATATAGVRGMLTDHLGFGQVAALPFGTWQPEGAPGAAAPPPPFAALAAPPFPPDNCLSLHRRRVPSDLY